MQQRKDGEADDGTSRGELGEQRPSPRARVAISAPVLAGGDIRHSRKA